MRRAWGSSLNVVAIQDAESPPATRGAFSRPTGAPAATEMTWRNTLQRVSHRGMGVPFMVPGTETAGRPNRLSRYHDHEVIIPTTTSVMANRSGVTLSLIHISEPTRPLYISYAVFCLKKARLFLCSGTCGTTHQHSDKEDIFLMIRRPPRSTHCISSAASDVYKRQFPMIGDPTGVTLSLIHISEPTRPLYISYAVFCLKKFNASW